MLHIHTSNRLEHLSLALAEVIKDPLSNPFAQETVVVQSQGMERWISMELARHLGVWANGSFPFPNLMLWRLFTRFSETSKFEPEVMLWSLMEILPKYLSQPEFAEVKSYLDADTHNIKQFQLAWRIADIFDQYLIYRPRWIADWEDCAQPVKLRKNPQAVWQAILWRELVARHGNKHRANLKGHFFESLKHSENVYRLPQRFSVFGIPALPPFHLEVFEKVAHLIDVHIFLLNPCQEYWGDIVSDRDIAHKSIEEQEHLQKGQTLLASMGKMGRDFIEMLIDYPHELHENFEEPSNKTLLRCIQSDILHLRENTKYPIDNSIQIHVCHSPMRQVEVLHDQLLALFEEDRSLLPKDVVVMMPDIETYAPFIEAVFNTIPDQAQKIPFSIADRSLRAESSLVDAFFAILELGQSRFSVTQVLTVLETETVQQRFDFVALDLELIRHWIKQTEIRWGIDKQHKTNMQLPAFDENTWRAGLKRLLLGYALPSDSMFEGILPFNDIEGDDALILGKLVAVIDQLFELVQTLKQERSIDEWVKFLMQMLEQFLHITGDNEDQAQYIRNIFSKLLANSKLAQFEQAINFDVIQSYLQYYLTNEAQPIYFMTGGVSFCTLSHNQRIPFKVVCLLGMDDQAYPRPNSRLGFDLIAKYPSKGDRSRRQNDRYLFLEALLSARDYFYISYIGKSIHDDAMMPPSVLVSELLESIENGEKLVTEHPLQAFSPRYFNKSDSKLFSFSTSYCDASKALMQQAQSYEKFITHDLPEPETAACKSITLERFTRFFRHPTEFLLKQRLGISLKNHKNILNETEPFEMQGLDHYQLSNILVEKSLAGIDLEEYKIIAKASGQLPHGKIGEHVYNQVTEQIKPFVKSVQDALNQDKIEAVKLNLKLSHLELTGYLGKLWRYNLIHYRYGELKAKDHIQIWIHHLILNAINHKNLPRNSILIGKNGRWDYEKIHTKTALKILNELSQSYWQGLSEVLHFFPESSFKYAYYIKKEEKNAEKALEEAKKQWLGSDFKRGEAKDEYHNLCFGKGEMPLDNKEFENFAMQFFQPLLEHATFQQN
ncbi:exodeoxyribonuclease V subunit gamma [Candidatus Marithrix sp. Canyon 246]|uniref:exodeoxyribonuclease V subunit gamma n=1 Tax=Candidatus Marithrix sp. Canyon 246 TaxID=1827136 RepID=UPI0009F2E306|nr:exodeoxyribonuclease V subunit gamma [Candidatus Marithrix sp. Canyon 246]